MLAILQQSRISCTRCRPLRESLGDRPQSVLVRKNIWMARPHSGLSFSRMKQLTRACQDVLGRRELDLHRWVKADAIACQSRPNQKLTVFKAIFVERLVEALDVHKCVTDNRTVSGGHRDLSKSASPALDLLRLALRTDAYIRVQNLWRFRGPC